MSDKLISSWRSISMIKAEIQAAKDVIDSQILYFSDVRMWQWYMLQITWIAQEAWSLRVLLTSNFSLWSHPERDIGYTQGQLCSIEKASEAHEHLVKYAVAVFERQLPLPKLLQLEHLLVHHVQWLSWWSLWKFDMLIYDEAIET